MAIPINRALLTAVKYALYTGAGALITYFIDLLPNLDVNYAIWVPVIGGLLKAIGTFVATKADELKP